MRKTQFRAVARNEAGLTFLFHFQAVNWCGIQEVAAARLAKIVAADPLHQKHGPWTATGITVGY